MNILACLKRMGSQKDCMIKKKGNHQLFSSLTLGACEQQNYFFKLGKRFGKAAAQFHVAAQLGMESLSMAVLSLVTKWKRMFVLIRKWYFFLQKLGICW